MENAEQFDLGELNILSGGDRDFLIKMLETFSGTIPPFIEKMKDALTAKNIADLANIGHRLKPSFHYLGRTDLTDLLGIIENGDGSKKDAEIYAATTKFLDAAKPMLPAVDEHIKKLKKG
jgi:HPt (histidine-containing phosphotransfer) domain-containing protein